MRGFVLKYACIECKKPNCSPRDNCRCTKCAQARKLKYNKQYIAVQREERRARKELEAVQPVERPICSQIELYRAEKLARTERGPGTLAMQVYMEVMRELGESKERKTRQPMGKAA